MFDSSAPILVTGGAGYIGSHTVRLLAGQGRKIVVLDNLVFGHDQAIIDPEVELVVGDVGDQDLLRALFAKHRFGAVIHFAAYAYVGESVTNPLKYYQNNTAEPIKLLQHISLGNVLRLSLLGARERISAQTALQIGLVTEVVSTEELHDAAAWLAESVASLPANVSAGTLRAVWAANDLGPLGAKSMAPSILSTATDKDVMRAGNEAFENQPRITPRIR